MENILILGKDVPREHESNAVRKRISIPNFYLPIVADSRTSPQDAASFANFRLLGKAKAELFKIFIGISLTPISHCPILPQAEVS